MFVVTAPPLAVHTARMTAFSPREDDGERTWRWMGPEASWTVVNSRSQTIAATVDIEISAFVGTPGGTRGLTILLDDVEVQALVVEEERRVHRIGSLALTRGNHTLVFRPTEPPTVADDVLNNGDRRPLAFGFGTWHWTVEGAPS